MLLPAGRRTLRVDLFDPGSNRLIEAKATASRENVRYAIGQLLDYRRYIDPRPSLALLVGNEPAQDMLRLLKELQITAIWQEGKTFVEALP